MRNTSRRPPTRRQNWPRRLPGRRSWDFMKPSSRGLREQAFEAAGRLAETTEPLAVIDSELVPALDEVGRGYEQGRLFLPQLLMSAEAAGAAFEALRTRMDAAGRKTEKKGRILLATVKGDIHDIGKNIVRALLENYGYDVVDLGKDVDPAPRCRNRPGAGDPPWLASAP